MPKKLILLYISLAFTLLLPLQQAAYADSEIKVVRFVEEANWPPFTPDKFGIATEGLSLKLMQSIFSRLGIKVEIELLPQKRMLEYLQTGKKDAATVISMNKSRQEYLDFSEPLFAKRGYIYYSSGSSPVNWESYKDLQGLVLGTVAGHNYGEEFSIAVQQFNLNVIPLSRARQGFDLLLANRIDGFLCINLTANHFLNEQKYSGKISHSPKSYYSKDYHIAFSKKSNASSVIPRLNDVITQMQKDGSLAEILSPFLK